MSTALTLMTVDELLPWAEGQEGRWELHDGVPKRITPERADHVSDAIETRVISEGAVKLNPPGFEVAVEALFPLPRSALANWAAPQSARTPSP